MKKDKSDIIGKYLDNTLSSEESIELSAMLKNKENVAEFNELVQTNHLVDIATKKFDAGKAFEKFNAITEDKKSREKNVAEFKEQVQTNHLVDIATKKFDTEKAFERFNALTEEKISKEKKGVINLIRPYFKYAAILIVVFAVGFYFVNRNINSYVSISTLNAQKSSIELPDGTKVWINAGSTLSYKKDFIQDERRIKLNGEAYFEVTKNESKPFIVELNDKSTITVLGTSFDVKSYKEDTESVVTLLEGKIKFIPKKAIEKAIIMNPGSKVVIENATNDVQLLAEENVISTLSWRNDELIFNRENLINIVNELKRFYNMEIAIKSKDLENQLFTASFEKGTSITDALNALSISGDFNFRINNATSFEIYNKD